MTTRLVYGIGILMTLLANVTACTAPSNAPPAAPRVATATPARSGRRGEGAGTATPVAAVGCAGYVAWRDDPQTAAALENVSVWPEVVAAGEQAVGGGSVDKARLEQIHAQIIQSASRIRLSDAAASDEEMAQLASRAMGLASRLALGLSEGSLDQQQVELAAARLNEAIAAYEAEAAVRQAQCG